MEAIYPSLVPESGYIPARVKEFRMFVHMLFVIILEIKETIRIKQDKNNYNLSIAYTFGFVTMSVFLSSIIYFSVAMKFS